MIVSPFYELHFWINKFNSLREAPAIPTEHKKIHDLLSLRLAFYLH